MSILLICNTMRKLVGGNRCQVIIVISYIDNCLTSIHTVVYNDIYIKLMAINVTIQGDNLSFTKETSLQKAGQIITFLSLDESSIKSPQPTALKELNSLSDLSPQELINQAKAKTNAQKITVLTQYLSGSDQEGALSKEVLLQMRKMGEEPANFKRDLRTAESLQYIYVIDPKKGLYGISEKGKQAIQKGFSDIIPTKFKVKIKGKGGFKRAIPPRQEVLSLALATNLEGYPDFHALPTKADSILWILAYADSKGIEELTPKEVEIISDKLRNKITQNAFSPFNKKNIKSGFVSPTNGKFKLQQRGTDHLKTISPVAKDVTE